MAEAPINVGIPLSPSARNAAARFAGEERIRSSVLIQEILRVHPEYAGGKASEFAGELRPQGGELRTAQDWLREVAALFDPDKVSQLNGRLVILGLSRIDPTLKTCESCNLLVKELLAEHTPAFDTLLRGDGGEEKTPDAAPITLEDAEALLRITLDPPVRLAMNAADMLAARTSRDADSVLLLAGLLYAGLSGAADQAPSTARFWQALVQGRYPDGSGEADDPGRAVIDTLELDRNQYSISAWPSATELNEHSLAPVYYQWVQPAVQPPPSPEPGTEIIQVLMGAIRLAERTNPLRQVRSRHLLGAMLSARLVDPPPAVQTLLRSGGYDLVQLRELLLDHIRDAPDGEPPEIWEAVLLTPPERTQSSAGYLTDMVDGAAKDHLDIEAEVETVAYVLTSKRVNPPLSLGLFGDWGSGKSFFMAKLRNYVSAIAARYLGEEMATGEPTQWCSRVLQIDFNAWHYSDANLWASLVTHIYDEMDRELTNRRSDRELKEQLEGKVEEAEGVVREAKRQVDAAETRVDSAAEALQAARRQREEAEAGVQSLVKDMAAALQKDNEAARSLRKAATALGYPEAAESYEAMVELEADLQSFSGRLSRLSVGLLRTPWTLMALALLILGLPIGISLALTFFADEISVMSQRIVEASAFVVSLSAGLRLWIGRGMRLISTVETNLQAAKDIHRERIESDEYVVKARKELIKAQSAEQAARESLQGAQAHLQELEGALKELKPERRLLRLIEERASTAAYSQHLGIISLIRADFDRISKLLVEMSKEKRDLTKELPPIQRIILYIDDLDRCRPDRVVEVLEAVHLLLAFPLFVVVVGVDPRWLRHSLTQHYPHTLAKTGEHVSSDGRGGPSLISTPQDYLEKIFQIPFALRPVEQTGYHNMVTELLEPMRAFELHEPAAREREDQRKRKEEEKEKEKEPSLTKLDEGIEPTDVDQEKKVADQEVEEVNGTDKAEAPEELAPSLLPPLTLREISPQQLTFTDQEKRDIDGLWPLFRTPRTVKRFVNIYRLLRTGLADDAEVKRFEETEYQVALLLLAVMTSFPNQSNRFLYRLDAWLEGLESTGEPPGETPLQWGQFLDALRKTSGEDGSGDEGEGNEAQEEGAASRDGDQGNAAQEKGAASRDGDQGNGEPPKDEDPAWEGMIECLEKVTGDGFQQTFSRETAERWARRVARYSFSIHPDQAL